MERNRESRRSSSMANGFPKRRHKAISLKDSSDDRAVVETSSKRGMNPDRERDSSIMNKRKRRRSFNSQSHTTDDDSAGNEQDDVQDAGISFTRSYNTTLSNSDQNHRRNFTAAKPPPQPPLKVTDEMIGVAVPRKARSASVRRSPASGGEEHNFRQPSNSPGRDCVDRVSPSFSSKTKAVACVAKTSTSCSSDMDIEMAELLFDLMTSKNHKLKDVEEKKVEDCNASADLDCHENGSTEAPKKDTGKDNLNLGAGCDGVTANRRSISPTMESTSCSELDFDKQDSASARVLSEAKHKRADKFEIDLMAPPSMMLSPDGGDLSKGDCASKIKALALDVEMKKGDSVKLEDKVERSVKKEKSLEETEEAKMLDFKEKRDVPNHDLENSNNDSDIKTNVAVEEQDRNKEQPTKSSNPRVEKTVQSSSVPLLTAVSGRPNSLFSIGYKPHLQTVLKMDKTTASSTELQHADFVLSQPQPKRCATHQYIARNIFLHQQFLKTKSLLPASFGTASLCSTNANTVPSTESMVDGKQSSKHLSSVNQSMQGKVSAALASDPTLAAIKNSNNTDGIDSTQRMQFVLQQVPHPGSTSSLVGPAFPFSPGQHQATLAAGTSQAGGENSTSSASSHSKSHSSAVGSLGNSPTLPEVATTRSFRYPKISTSDTPHVTTIQNNGYSFPLSNSLGATAATRGTSPAQATHIINGPFYSSQIFHPLQHPQQHPHSQALVQSSYLTASTPSGSSSHKKPQGGQVNGNNILTSTTAQPQHLQKQQTSLTHHRQYGNEMSGENASSVANRTSYPSKNVHGHNNYTIPVQPVNLSFRPSATSDIVSGNGENFGDKQRQQQASKGGVEVVPSQAFAISFAAFNGTNIPSNLNFSSIAQNPVIFQSLPDIAWQGYQAASMSQTTPQKTNSITEGKSGGNSSHQDGEKKTTHGKSSTNGPTTLVFDNSSNNLNFIVSPTNGNWPSHSIASTAMTSVPLSSNASNSQQPSQLHQLQKQHVMQRHQPAMATRYNASASIATTKFPNNAPLFSQTVTQCKSSNQGSHSKSLGRAVDSHVHQTSGITSNAPTLKSFSQEQGRVSQGHMQISFAGNYITSLPAQGQQLLNNNQPLYTTAAGTQLNEGKLKPSSEGRNVRQ
ncbi:hypothetical protein Lal_00047392 [Lupinus albus]|uniref:Uncharacterized protein n=1 Tax=Lupinus albus TaxID=3870 RepID=A0A6A4QUB1_LUPAL|nr:hypothetical protein Lalb_Chr02g0142731 [Lupinus albus]KAF1878721.1 hypothetical protein Lal_00047392 [Lupinus albus]